MLAHSTGRDQAEEKLIVTVRTSTLQRENKSKPSNINSVNCNLLVFRSLKVLESFQQSLGERQEYSLDRYITGHIDILTCERYKS